MTVPGVLLSHRCWIERQAAGVNNLGEPTGAWSDVESNLECMLFEKRERIWTVDYVERLAVTTNFLILPSGSDIEKGDRVRSIEFGDGSSDGPYLVEAILIRRRPGHAGSHHLTVELKDLS